MNNSSFDSIIQKNLHTSFHHVETEENLEK